MAYNVLDIANKLLDKATYVAGGDLMSNMRLQKMLYYEQGYHLAVFGTPLFDDEIEAWMYGPVVPCVYDHYKEYGAGGITPDETDIITLTYDEECLFNEVFDAYVDFSTYGLMQKTHEESPWRSTESGKIIGKDKLTAFFKTKIQ